jgi:hypothetical protein
VAVIDTGDAVSGQAELERKEAEIEIKRKDLVSKLEEIAAREQILIEREATFALRQKGYADWCVSPNVQQKHEDVMMSIPDKIEGWGAGSSDGEGLADLDEHTRRNAKPMESQPDYYQKRDEMQQRVAKSVISRTSEAVKRFVGPMRKPTPQRQSGLAGAEQQRVAAGPGSPDPRLPKSMVQTTFADEDWRTFPAPRTEQESNLSSFSDAFVEQAPTELKQLSSEQLFALQVLADLSEFLQCICI